MKKHIISLSIALALITTSTHAGWFGNDHKVQQLEHRLEEQRQQTGCWQVIAGGLAVFVVVAFTLGTILGSRTRRKHEPDTHE